MSYRPNKEQATSALRRQLSYHLEKHGTLFMSKESLIYDYRISMAIVASEQHLTREEISKVLSEFKVPNPPEA